MTLENLANTAVNVGQYITQLNQQGGAQDAANLVASNDPQVQDAPGAPVGSGLQRYWAQNYSSPLPSGLQGIIGTKQAAATNQVAQDAISGKVDAPTALAKVSQITGGDPTKLIGMVSMLKAYGLAPQTPQNTQPVASAASPSIAQQAPNLASFSGNGSQGDSTPNQPEPANVSGAMPYPRLAAANGLLSGGQQPQAALPLNASPMAIGTSQVESGGRDYNPDGSVVTSPKGAQAAMQVMPATAANPGLGVTPAQNNSPQEIDRVGVDYQNALLKKYGGNQKLAAAAYNAGMGRVDTALQQSGGDPDKALSLLPQETQAYVPKVADATNAAQAVPTGGMTPAMMQAAIINGGSPIEMMKTGSELQKNAAETNAANATAAEKNWEMGGPSAGGGNSASTGTPPQGGAATTGTPGLGGKAAQEVAQKAAEEKNTDAIAAQKNATLMLANLPVMNSQFDRLRTANAQASFSPINDEEGNGIITTMHGLKGKGSLWSGTEGDAASQANSALKTLAAQNVIKEIGPQLSQNGIKGNKFLETLVNSAAGVDLNASRGSRDTQINLLGNNYYQGLKSSLQQMKSYGLDPVPLIHQSLPDRTSIADAVKRGAISREDALNVYRQYHGAK